MTAHHRIPRSRVASAITRVLLAAALFGFALPRDIGASIRPEDQGRIGQPRLVFPAAGEKLVESAVRFAFEMPSGATRPMLVLSRHAFESTGWTSLPGGSEFIVHEAVAPLTSLAELGVHVDAETRLWWAVADRDPGTGLLRVSEARSFTVEPRFTNRIAASPFLRETAHGTMGNATSTAAAAASSSGPPHIRLSAGYDFAPSEGVPAPPSGLTESSANQPGELRAYIVQFSSMPSAAEVARINAAGGSVFSYIPDQAYLVRMTEDARSRLAAEAGVAWIGDYQPAYKMSTLIDHHAIAPARYTVLLFPDASIDATLSQLAALGATVVDKSDNGINKMVRFQAPVGLVASVASLSQVAWVEPVIPMRLFNDQAQWVVQTNILNNRRVWDMGIHGEGQVVNTSDSGITMDHEMFLDPAVPVADFGDYPTHRKVIAYVRGSDDPGIQFGDHAPHEFHGTHTAGTMVGDDSPNGDTSTRDGMALKAKIYFSDLSGATMVDPNTGSGLVAPPADLNDLYLPPYLGNAGGAARLSSNSWGGAVAGAYTLQAMTADQFVHDHPDFYLAFATGNSGTAGSVGSPATFKNGTGAGGTANGASNTIASFTSRGPCEDGRRKPTFCTPATLTSASGAPGVYLSLSGTSMATPSGTGAVTLMRQYCTEGWYPTGTKVPANGFAPSAALLKALAINAAANVVPGFSAPDNNVGYGKLAIDNALYFAGDTRKLLLVDQTAGLGSGQYIEYQVNVVDGSVPLKASLCWTDFPGNPAGAKQLVNDLDLTVSQGATVYKGNVFSGGVSLTGGTYDDLNVEEAVLVSAPATGIWTVRVDAPAVPMGPQPFGLVITGGVGTTAGTVAMDRGEYGSTSTVQLQVTDTDAGPSVNVSLTSNSETTPLVLTLNGSNGIYAGTVTLTPTAASDNDGLLSVSDGDLITATYQDASPVATLNATAKVSLASPIITNVHALPQGSGQARIVWDSNLNATSRVYYGLTPSLELGAVDGSGAPLTHAVTLSGLAAGSTYYYDVESVALSGNLARDDFGGAHYRFTAKDRGDILMVFGVDGFERSAAWESALQANGWDYDVWGGSLADSPILGDLVGGLRSYQAVLWQPGFEEYPGFTDAAQGILTSYLDGGGRLLVDGHDVCWGMSDPTSPSYTPQRRLWVQNTLRAIFKMDPAVWDHAVGVAGDPITGSYVSGIPYTPFRSGGSGDEIAINVLGGGTGTYILSDAGQDASPDNVAFRWESSTNNGSAASAFWGGKPSRLVNLFLEFTALDPPFSSPSATRNDLLEKAIIWLLGRSRPTVAITSPNGGEEITSSTVSIHWSEAASSGFTITSRTLEYSLDGGGSWNPLASGVGPSPYAWDVSGLQNTTSLQVRIKVKDSGSPALTALDASDANFTLNRSGGDTQGPLVVAGSMGAAPNPIVRPNPATLTAQVSEANTGGSNVIAAEWSMGAAPAAAGNGTAMSGSFGAVTVDVHANLDTSTWPTGPVQLWVRGEDAGGTWGPASSMTVQVNPVTGVDQGVPRVAFLSQNAPNPFLRNTTITFGLPRSGPVRLSVVDLQGRQVRSLVEGSMEAAVHRVGWDGRDDSGAPVSPGIYLYRLVTPEGKFDRRLAVLK